METEVCKAIIKEKVLSVKTICYCHIVSGGSGKPRTLMFAFGMMLI
jgi:hypothetical protein